MDAIFKNSDAPPSGIIDKISASGILSKDYGQVCLHVFSLLFILLTIIAFFFFTTDLYLLRLCF